MKLNSNSIAFKTAFKIVAFSLVFVLFIGFIAKNIFSSAYMNVEQEKAKIIIDNIEPSIALNLSYNFIDALSEIAHNTLKNEDVLLLKIENYENQEETQTFTNLTLSLQEYRSHEELIEEVILIDPATKSKIGKLTMVYSNDTYEEFMHKFYKWFFSGISLFFLSIVFLSFTLFKSLKNLSLLDNKLKSFNPKKPEKLSLDISGNDEVSSISKSANKMIENIINFLNSEKLLHSQLVQSQAHLKNAQRMAKVGSFEYNVIKNELSLSDEYYRILGLNLHISLTWSEFLNKISQEDYNTVITTLDSAIKNGSNFEISYALKIENSKLLYIQTKGKVRKKQDGSVQLTAISMDITEDVKNKKTIEKLAYFDALTGLANRTLLKDRMVKAMQRAKRTHKQLAVIFLDLDHFKLINDTLGHSVGDELLIYVSELLKDQIRESDTLSRLGGDEFVIFLPSISESNDVYLIAQKILASLQNKHPIGTHELYITSSIGISIFPEHGKNCDELIRNADTAMYEAKHEGRNRFKVYSNNMGNFVDKQMNLEQDLTKAVKTKDQIEVFYQAKIDSITKTVSGAEALVRWRHPTAGLIYPDNFIYLAESTGLMIELGNIITESAIAHIHNMNRLGFNNIKIAINLSARQFQDSNLVPFILSMLQKYDVSPSQVEFEITENISMTNMNTTLKILTELKNVGLSIAIDDFGTGHSSLAYLKKFPIDILKIDQSFVRDIIDNEEDRVIAQTIISMAHSLGMETVAEGVETEEHVSMLCNMDCDILQGYYYSKPISKDDFITFLQNYKIEI